MFRLGWWAKPPSWMKPWETIRSLTCRHLVTTRGPSECLVASPEQNG